MILSDYLDTIQSSEKRNSFESLLNWAKMEFPNLELEVKWNQPMFTHKGTFIISFSAFNNHFSVAPEKFILDQFIDQIAMKYSHSKKMFQIKWNQMIDYELLREIIKTTIEYKKDYPKFWL